MLITPEIITLQILNFIFFLFLSLAFYLSVKIYFRWDYDSVDSKQYALEKQSYLASVIIKYVFIVKLAIFIFFIFTLDKLSTIITGAMCAAGIVDATDYGNILLVLKIINLYFFGFWLVLHHKDIKKEDLPYTKQKFGIFLVLFIVFIIEIFIETLMFMDIDINALVDCCGALYSNSATSYISVIFAIDTTLLVAFFYSTYLVMFLLYLLKQKALFALLNSLFIIIALVSLISFFGTYIYQLPTHHCPFCFLQSDYHYVGYLLYFLLFVGTFNGMVSGFVQDSTKTSRYSIIINGLYVLVVTLYPLLYYFENGVWL